jgi:hypothetical protein
VTARRFRRSFEDMVKKSTISSTRWTMPSAAPTLPSLFLNTVKYENDKLGPT